MKKGARLVGRLQVAPRDGGEHIKRGLHFAVAPEIAAFLGPSRRA